VVFSSPVFLFLFLPLFLLGYYLAFAPAEFARSHSVKRLFTTVSNIFILAASLVFYFWGENWLVLIMLTSTVIDFSCGLMLGRSSSLKARRAILGFSIAANLSLLGYFKYAGFGVESFNALAGWLGFASWQVTGFTAVALPLGISFYTFQSMSYTIAGNCSAPAACGSSWAWARKYSSPTRSPGPPTGSSPSRSSN
jgi:alginate O-acetyltransferase complex protein AlgI